MNATNETTTETYSGYLIVDWRDDNLRYRKTRPDKSDRGPTEYPVRVEVEVEVPEYDIPTLATELSVPESKVREVAAADVTGIVEGGPAWHETVEQALDHYADEAHALDPQSTEFDDLVSTCVGYILRRADGLPPVDKVENKVETALTAVAEGGEGV